MGESAARVSIFRFARTGADPPAVGSSSGIIMSVLSSRRYLSVWLRRLSTDRIERRSSERVETFVVVASIKGAQRITGLTDGAARLGLKAGMGLADARARYPKLPVVEADPEADRRLLENIADGCDRYTPLRVDAETVAGLKTSGLSCVADLAARPRAPFAARFGKSLLLRLDQALGDANEPITPRLPLPAAMAEQRFPEPIAREAD